MRVPQEGNECVLSSVDPYEIVRLLPLGTGSVQNLSSESRNVFRLDLH